MTDTANLKDKLQETLVKIRANTTCFAEYSAGFMDGQEAMLESIIEMIDQENGEYDEFDAFIAEFRVNQEVKV